MMNTEIASKIIAQMTFSALDYVQNSEQILTEAVSLYSGQTGDDSSEIKAGMRILLDRSFSERKVLSIGSVKLPGYLKDGSSFSITLNDTEVSGIVNLAPKEISVEIISPFQGKKAGSVLNRLTPVIWTERPDVGSEANESGRMKAVTLLADIYYSIIQNDL